MVPCTLLGKLKVNGVFSYSQKRIANWIGIGTQILLKFEERRWIYNPFFRKYLEWERNTLKKDFP